MFFSHQPLSTFLSFYLFFFAFSSWHLCYSLSVSLRNAEVTTDCTLSPLLRCSRPKNCMHINGGYSIVEIINIPVFLLCVFTLKKSRTIPYNVGKNLCCVCGCSVEVGKEVVLGKKSLWNLHYHSDRPPSYINNFNLSGWTAAMAGPTNFPQDLSIKSSHPSSPLLSSLVCPKRKAQSIPPLPVSSLALTERDCRI